MTSDMAAHDGERYGQERARHVRQLAVRLATYSWRDIDTTPDPLLERLEDALIEVDDHLAELDAARRARRGLPPVPDSAHYLR